MKYSINIVHLYPDLLNLYGDKGNIECLKKRLLWRGIDAAVTKCTLKEENFDLANADIVLLGGGNDRETEIVFNRLLEKKDVISEYIENGGVFLALCGGCELLGTSYKTAQKEMDGLGILDISTDASQTNNRLIGDIIIENDALGKIVGFENHAGRMEIGGLTPLGRVLTGFGNNDSSGFEGVMYKNLIGTYLHGPLLPKNPNLCDYILNAALKHKYPDFSSLAPLDDTLENQAKEYVLTNLSK